MFKHERPCWTTFPLRIFNSLHVDFYYFFISIFLLSKKKNLVHDLTSLLALQFCMSYVWCRLYVCMVSGNVVRQVHSCLILFHELLHLFRRRPIVIHRLAVNHFLLWLHTLQTNTSRDKEMRSETKQKSQ